MGVFFGGNNRALKVSNLLQNSPQDCFFQIEDLEQLVTGSSYIRTKKETPLWVSLFGGNNRARTCDPLLVRQMLSQLSYAPVSVIYYIIINPFVKGIFTKNKKGSWGTLRK